MRSGINAFLFTNHFDLVASIYFDYEFLDNSFTKWSSNFWIIH